MKKNQKQHSFRGTETLFAQKVYAIVARIPKGKTLTYGEVAKKAGRPKAFRAVGSIMGANRDRTVPCHRVIRADGGMGGYAFGGSARKRSILKKEGAI